MGALPRQAPVRRRRLFALPGLLLGMVLLQGTAQMLHARLLQLGERIWPRYALLRQASEQPCLTPQPQAPPARAAQREPDDLLAGLSAAVKQPVDQGPRCRQEPDHRGLSPGWRAFRSLEGWVGAGVDLGASYLRHALVLLVLLGAAVTSALRSHICLRAARTLRDHLVSEGAQALAYLLLLSSWYAQWRIDLDAGIDVQHGALPLLWMGGCTLAALVHLHHLPRPPASLPRGGGVGPALLSVPLYAVMTLLAGAYFLLIERHPSGLAIYLQKLTEHALLYLHVGLYVLAGMLLMHTCIARRVFDALRPLRLPPQLLAAVVVLAAAFPTAYSGASGIFVIATGAIVVEELSRAGLRRSLVLAATAMSGSLGVVLRPCLLVVLIASLNKQVTTDQLYHWGLRIYLLTGALLLGACLLEGRLGWRPPRGAFVQSCARLRPLLPHALIGTAVLAGYRLGLDVPLDEHTAPTVLPVLLLLLLGYDRSAACREAAAGRLQEETRYADAVLQACGEATSHIGALLMLMGASICLGGILERGEYMSLVPQTFSSPLGAMLVLVGVLVLVGMIMDPYGGVILISASIAEVAYRNGIDPVHFWMTVLVSFELGYLTPPVALNQLLAQRVVEQHEAHQGGSVEEAARPPAARSPGSTGRTRWERHERTLIPCLILGTSLLLVAFVPLLPGLRGRP